MIRLPKSRERVEGTLTREKPDRRYHAVIVARIGLAPDKERQ